MGIFATFLSSLDVFAKVLLGIDPANVRSQSKIVEIINIDFEGIEQALSECVAAQNMKKKCAWIDPLGHLKDYQRLNKKNCDNLLVVSDLLLEDSVNVCLNLLNLSYVDYIVFQHFCEAPTCLDLQGNLGSSNIAALTMRLKEQLERLVRAIENKNAILILINQDGMMRGLLKEDLSLYSTTIKHCER